MAIIKNPVTVVQQSGGSGGGEGDSGGKYLVQVITPYGDVIKSDHLNTGDVFTLPEAPVLDGLTFQEYSSPVTITDNTVTVENQDITIDAVYTTTSGKSEFDITLTKVTGLEVSIKCSGEIDWGDGTVESTTSSPSTHIYTNYGDYTIKVGGLTSISRNFMGNTGINANSTLKAVRLGSTVTSLSNSAFYNCRSLIRVSSSNSVTNLGEWTFQNCYSLEKVTIPSGVTVIGMRLFDGCMSLKTITIPSGVTKIDNYSFHSCNSLITISIPSSITSIGDYSFQNCYAIRNAYFPSNVKNIGSRSFDNCSSLESLKMSNGINTIGTYAFANCYSLRSVVFPNSITNISSYAFSIISGLHECDFSQFTSIPTVGGYAFGASSSINKICKIIVPDALYDQWIAATNWSTYADYIYKASEVTD